MQMPFSKKKRIKFYYFRNVKIISIYKNDFKKNKCDNKNTKLKKL